MTSPAGAGERLLPCSATDMTSGVPGTPGSLAVEVGNQAPRAREDLGEQAAPPPGSGASLTGCRAAVMTRMCQFGVSARAERGRDGRGVAPDRARHLAVGGKAADARLHPRPQRRRPLAQHGGDQGVRRHARQADHPDRRTGVRRQGAAGVRREAARDTGVDGGDGCGPHGGGTARPGGHQLDAAAPAGIDRRRLRARRSRPASHPGRRRPAQCS